MRRHGLTHRGLQADVKSAGDYVTAADRESEAAILEVLAREAPGISVLAEEEGGTRGDTMWTVDPLDGTTNYVHGFPMVGLSVALLDGGRPVLGVVIALFLDLEFASAKGEGVTRNGERLPALPEPDVSRAVVATGFPFRHKERFDRYMPVMEAALRRFEDLRRAGAAALDLAFTASGVLDGFFELGLGTWDVAAGAVLVQEVGGRVSDWSGGDRWLESGDIIAAPPAVHEALLEITNSGGGA